MMLVFLQNLCSEFVECRRQADARKRLWLYVGVYTLAFLAAFLIAYSPAFGKSFIFPVEGRWQHFPLLVYIGKTLRGILMSLLGGSLSIPFFDISLFAGDDFIAYLSSSSGSDPLLLLSALVPTKYSAHLYAFLAIFRVYLAGLSFSYLCFYFKKRKLHTLIGSMVYCFSGYALFCSMRHPYFVNPMVILPLLIVGIDKILKKEKPYVFILAVFYGVLCGYYFLYMMTLIVLFYAAVRFFDLYTTSRSREFLLAWGRGAVAYILGLGLGGIVLLPGIMEFLNAARSGFSNDRANALSYAVTAQMSRLAHLIAPPGSWEHHAFAAITILAVVLLLFAKRRRTLQILFIVAVVVLFTNTGGMIMNGFQYPSNRWSFGLVLVAAYGVVEMLPALLEPSRKQQMLCFATFTLYLLVCFFTVFGRNLKYFSVGVTFLAVTLLGLNVKLRKMEARTGEGERPGLKVCGCYYREILCLILIILNVGVNGIYLYGKDQGAYVNTFARWGYEVNRLQGDIIRELRPLLAKNPAGRGDGSRAGLMSDAVWQVPAMSTNSSVANRNIVEFWEKVENCGRTVNYCIYNTDQRAIINTLFSGLYQVETPQTTGYVPYGYSKFKSTEKGNAIYKNNYALPWGYTYDNTITYESLDGLSPLKKQEAMVQAIALDGGAVPVTGEADLTFDAKQLPYTLKYTDCEWKNGRLTVKRPNGKILLTFTLPAGAEEYVRLRGFDINNSGALEFSIWAQSGAVAKKAQAYSQDFSFYWGRENYLFNLGYSDRERRSATLTFPRPGTYKLKDIELYALPMTNYPARVNALRAEPLKNIQWGTNSLSGSVDLSKDKILCVSVPYSRGWTATVDGQEAEILRGNYMFMALPLKAGHHDIVFSYCTPGLKLGAVLTLISGCIVAGMLWRDRRKRMA